MNKNPKKNPGTGQSLLLTIIQTGTCAVIIAAAGCLKLIGGSAYSLTASWFFDKYNSTVFVTDEEGFSPYRDTVSITEKNKPFLESSAKSSKKINITLKPPLADMTVTSGFGNRVIDGTEQFHKGIDLSAAEGTDILAAADGTVAYAGEDNSYGKYIVIEHQDNIRTLYAHCSQLLCKMGSKVKTGTTIAKVGKTGNADGAHLHFEVIADGVNTDPEELLQ